MIAPRRLLRRLHGDCSKCKLVTRASLFFRSPGSEVALLQSRVGAGAKVSHLSASYPWQRRACCALHAAWHSGGARGGAKGDVGLALAVCLGMKGTCAALWSPLSEVLIGCHRSRSSRACPFTTIHICPPASKALVVVRPEEFAVNGTHTQVVLSS